ncbi:hypothetical protein DESUT3_01440 [Desulfuromonas versatilis]|uniref:Ribbon-helix-helix protein CopG domain-containing protein n=1 Tax=Desulfuromonas versatilis TaxID=2802975 RepID=A0ABN6DSA0_9BACT|nr:ribbon-helix-helix domain-containing protein [Desulfuromonas versatilis]BCR03075.1 hypothetical protein DESUT3_01440 [Desulfuromonas versatilis]
MSPKKKVARITVSLTQEEYLELEAVARSNDVSLSWVTRRAINEYLERNGKGSELSLPFDPRQSS